MSNNLGNVKFEAVQLELPAFIPMALFIVWVSWIFVSVGVSSLNGVDFRSTNDGVQEIKWQIKKYATAKKCSCKLGQG